VSVRSTAAPLASKSKHGSFESRYCRGKIALVIVWREAASLFTAREQAALLWTESVISAAETTIPNRDYVAVTSEFTSNELRDLTIIISLMNTYNQLGIRYRRNTPMLLEMHS